MSNIIWYGRGDYSIARLNGKDVAYISREGRRWNVYRQMFSQEQPLAWSGTLRGSQDAVEAMLLAGVLKEAA